MMTRHIRFAKQDLQSNVAESSKNTMEDFNIKAIWILTIDQNRHASETDLRFEVRFLEGSFPCFENCKHFVGHLFTKLAVVKSGRLVLGIGDFFQT